MPLNSFNIAPRKRRQKKNTTSTLTFEGESEGETKVERLFGDATHILILTLITNMQGEINIELLSVRKHLFRRRRPGGLATSTAVRENNTWRPLSDCVISEKRAGYC